ncbi:MAG: autotransporter outer membrane beta-barrel domain-containing protein, partial [Defluviicoccus sp.]|nr:autotransporter outer membrane beta-barrel domain-containing protein [Defluviicoccus sp.]
MLPGSSFALPLSGGEGGPLGNLTLWGGGDYRELSGGSRRSVRYDGDVTGAHLGLDARLGGGLLAGVSVGHARGAVDYRDGAAAGELTSTVTGIAPYAGWRSAGGLSLWAAAGYGWGEVEIDGGAGAETGDLTQQMAAAGASGRLLASTRLSEGGTTSIRLKGEAAYTRAELDGSGSLASATLDASRLRLAIEGSHAQRLASGASFTPSVEIGLRSDGGDGETGGGVETGGGMRYADPASGLAAELRGRTLLVHGGDYEEWGVAGSLSFDPGAAGRGLAIGVAPGWGRTASGARRLWEAGIAPGAVAPG